MDINTTEFVESMIQDLPTESLLAISNLIEIEVIKRVANLFKSANPSKSLDENDED